MGYYAEVMSRPRTQRVLHEATLELTYRCNLDCFFCYNDRDKVGEPLSAVQYRTLLEDLARLQTLHIMLTGGEPTVHPHFFDIGRWTRELGFVTRIRTNGHSLSTRQAQRIVDEIDPHVAEISLHGATAQSHDRQTRVPGSFDRLMRNLESARQVGLHCSLVCTPTRWNEHEIDDMWALAEGLDLKLAFQGPVSARDNGDTTPLAIQPDAAAWKTVHSLKRKARKAAASQVIASDTPKPAVLGPRATCAVGTRSVDIDPYGNVMACMHLDAVAGNLHQQDIATIWQQSPVFHDAHSRAVAAGERFGDQPLEQHGARLFCIAAAEHETGAQSCSDCAQHA